jgi:hypothetical protein
MRLMATITASQAMKILACAVALFITQTTFAATDAEVSFEALKSLQGTWSIYSDGKLMATQMTYGVGSKGSIVTEQFGKELSVFYRDGRSLLMTHFCNAGSQPRLRLTESSSPGRLQFDMFDITNLAERSEAHVQRIIYKIVDNRRIELEIVWRTGESETSEKYMLVRP